MGRIESSHTSKMSTLENTWWQQPQNKPTYLIPNKKKSTILGLKTNMTLNPGLSLQIANKLYWCQTNLSEPKCRRVQEKQSRHKQHTKEWTWSTRDLTVRLVEAFRFLFRNRSLNLSTQFPKALNWVKRSRVASMKGGRGRECGLFPAIDTFCFFTRESFGRGKGHSECRLNSVLLGLLFLLVPW